MSGGLFKITHGTTLSAPMALIEEGHDAREPLFRLIDAIRDKIDAAEKAIEAPGQEDEGRRAIAGHGE